MLPLQFQDEGSDRLYAAHVRVHGRRGLLSRQPSQGIEVEEVLHPLRGDGRGQLPGPGAQVMAELSVIGEKAPHVVHELDDICVLRVGRRGIPLHGPVSRRVLFQSGELYDEGPPAQDDEGLFQLQAVRIRRPQAVYGKARGLSGAAEDLRKGPAVKARHAASPLFRSMASQKPPAGRSPGIRRFLPGPGPLLWGQR